MSDGMLRAWSLASLSLASLAAGILAAGNRMTTVVSERLSSRSEIVRVCSADPAPAAVARSALAARLMVASGVPAGFRVPARSRPHATAPNASEIAITPRIPLDTFDMIRLPSPVAPWRSLIRMRRRGLGSKRENQLKYPKKISGEPERLWGLCVIPVAGLPPAPLTGDVGRGCGDASRALLFI